MARPYLRYAARRLTPRARGLRRNPTSAERKLWYELLRDLPDKFTRRKPLGRYIADFYCSSRKLVIEVDGDSHYVGRQPDYDERRTVDLAAMGVRVIRFTNAEVMREFEAVCETVLRELAP